LHPQTIKISSIRHIESSKIGCEPIQSAQDCANWRGKCAKLPMSKLLSL
jgi:hypothetical protein